MAHERAHTKPTRSVLKVDDYNQSLVVTATKDANHESKSMHGRRGSQRTMQPLELIHVDVCFGPPRGSVVEVVDYASALAVASEATRFNFVYGVDGNWREL